MDLEQIVLQHSKIIERLSEQLEQITQQLKIMNDLEKDKQRWVF